MLIRDDEVIQAIATARRIARGAANAHIKALQDEIQAKVQETVAADNASVKDVEDRLGAIGVAIFDRANHDVSYGIDEGVVWLEPKSAECPCPICQLGFGTFIVGRPPT